MNVRFARVCIGLLLVSMTCTVAHSQTTHSTHITKSETWGPGEHIVTAKIEVHSPATLTVEPGAVVKFETGAQLTVTGGSLALTGTEQKPIIFTAKDNPDAPSAGSWSGITLSLTSAIVGNKIEYVEIRGATNGISVVKNDTKLTLAQVKFLRVSVGINLGLNSVVFNGGEYTIRNSVFDQVVICFTGGPSQAGTGTLKLDIRGSIFSRWSNDCIRVGLVNDQSTVLLQNNLFHDPRSAGINNSAVTLGGRFTYKIRFNTFDGSSTHPTPMDGGLNVPFPLNGNSEIVGNLVTNFGRIGIYYGSPLTGTLVIKDNVAFGTKFGLTYCNFSTSFDESGCSLSANFNQSFDPKYRAPEKGDWTPTEAVLFDSLASSSYPGMTTDFLGNLRGEKLTPGAFERTMEVIAVKPAPGQPSVPRAGKTVTFHVEGKGFIEKCGLEVKTYPAQTITPDPPSVVKIDNVTVIDKGTLEITATFGLFSKGPRNLWITLKETADPKCMAEMTSKLSNAFSILAPLALDPEPVNPNQGVIGSTISVQIKGTGFSTGDSIAFINAQNQPETSVQVSKLTVVNSSLITADLKLLPGPSSKLKLKLKIDSIDKESAEAPDAFTVRLAGTPTEHSGILPGSDPGCTANNCEWGGLNRVSGSITVPSGVTLTLKQGAEVLFDESTGITVSPGGSLIMKGSIFGGIIELKPTQQGKLWSGVRILSDTTDKLISLVDVSGAVAGFYVSTVTGLTFQNVLVSDSTRAFWLADSSSIIVFGSIIRGVEDGVFLEGTSTLVLERSRVSDWSEIGLHVSDTGSKMTVRNNLFYLPESGATAIKLNGYGTIWFNTFDGRDNTGVPAGLVGIDLSSASTARPTAFHGNIVSGFKNAGIIFDTNNPAKVAIAFNNAWMNNPADACDFLDNNGANCHKNGPPKNPQSVEMPNLSVDPGYRNPLQADFRLGPDSTLYDVVGNKSLINTPAVDYAGNTRIDARDVGAWELPVVKTISPGYGIRGDTDLPVTISGHNFDSNITLLLDSNVPGTETKIAISETTRVSGTQITAKLTVDLAALLGKWDVEVKNAADKTLARTAGLFLVIPPYLSTQRLLTACVQDLLCTIEFTVCTPDGDEVVVTVEPNNTPQVENLKLNKISKCSYSITFDAKLANNQSDTEKTTLVLNVVDTGHVASKRSLDVTISNKNLGNTKPSKVVLDTPTDDAIIGSLTPELVVQNATDADDDALVYVFEVDVLSNFDQKDPSSEYITQTVDENSNQSSTTWQLQTLLKNQTIYYWRVRAFDGLEFGEWSETRSFRVKTSNEAPGKPVLIEPKEGDVLTQSTPPDFAFFATDPDDGRNFTVTLELYSDVNLANKVSELVDSDPGPGPNTTLTIGGTLSDGDYYWRVKAIDLAGAESPWSETWHFVIKTGLTPDPSEDTTTPDADDAGMLDSEDSVTADLDDDQHGPDTNDTTPTPDTSGDDGNGQDKGTTAVQDSSDTGGNATDASTTGDTGADKESGGGSCNIADNRGSHSLMLAFLALFALILRRRLRSIGPLSSDQ